MSTPELEDLIARFFEGDLDAAGEARLEELLAQNPGVSRRFRNLVGIEGLLRAREADEASRRELCDRVMESVHADDPRRRLTSRVMRSLKGSAPHERRRAATSRAVGRAPLRWGAWETLAACLVIGAAAALAFLLLPADPAPEPTPEPAITRKDSKPPLGEPVPVPRPEVARERSPERPLPLPEPKRTQPAAPRALPPAPSEPPIRPETPRPPTASAPDADPQPKPPAARPPRPATVAAVHLRVEKVEGQVFVLEHGKRTPAAAGRDLPAGLGLETGEKESSAVLAYPDGTRLEIGPGTTITEFADRNPGRGRKLVPGKRIVVAKGTVRAGVVRQPAGEPLHIAAPHGELRVLGTSFLLTVTPDPKGQTVVRVEEGKVRFSRAWDGRSVELTGGQFAVAAPDVELAPRAIAANEIVLLPRHGRIVGNEWRLVVERRGTTGLALETRESKSKTADHVRAREAYVHFTFFAEAGKDYYVWVRAFSVPTGDPWERDQLNLQIPGAKFNQQCPFGHWWEDAYTYTGFSEASSFSWISGNMKNADPNGKPVSVRFDTPGPKTLKLFVAQPSIRVDTVWLSATRSIRPSAKMWPPLRPGK